MYIVVLQSLLSKPYDATYVERNGIFELIAGSPRNLANAGANVCQEVWATVQLVAVALAQSAPTEVPFGIGGDSQSAFDSAREAMELMEKALGFKGSEDININENKGVTVLHAVDPVPSNTPLKQVTGKVIEMEGGGKRKKRINLSTELRQQPAFSFKVIRPTRRRS